jgi:hypothetical protein
MRRLVIGEKLVHMIHNAPQVTQLDHVSKLSFSPAFTSELSVSPRRRKVDACMRKYQGGNTSIEGLLCCCDSLGDFM